MKPTVEIKTKKEISMKMANYDGILYLRSKHCVSGLPAAKGR